MHQIAAAQQLRERHCFISMQSILLIEKKDKNATASPLCSKPHLRNKYHQGTGQYKVNIARDELASFAGTATDSLIRTLGEFKQEKLIAIKGPVITLLEPGRLEGIAFH